MFVAGVGFCNVDILYSGIARMPDEGEEIFSKGFDLQLGGGVPATMINVARLGIPTKLGTFVGGDLFSEFVKKEFEKYGVSYQNFYKGSGNPLTITSALITEFDRTFISYRDNLIVDDPVAEKVYEISKGSKITQMHIGFLDTYKKLKKEGTILVLDTGWEDDMSIEKYADYIELADYYTPNRKEAMKITGRPHVEESLSVLSKYFDHAIIKLDKEGCLINEKGKISVVPPMLNVEAIDYTGAGDAFMAGFLYGIFKEFTFKESILCGNITGGTCVQGIGCLSKYVDEEQLLKKVKEIKEQSA